MKLANAAKQDVAVEKPFRKLKVAAGVLAGAIFAGTVSICAVSVNDFEKSEKWRREREAALDARDSMVRARGWAPITGYDGNWFYRDETRRSCISHRSGRLRDAANAGERLALLKDIITEFQWKGRLYEALGAGDDSAARRRDSVFLVEGIVAADSAGLAELAGYMRKPDSSPRGHERDSLASAIANRFRPMLPEARDYRLLADTVLAGYERRERQEANAATLRTILADMRTLKSTLRMAGCEPGYIKSVAGRDTNLLESSALFSLQNEPDLYDRFVRHALGMFWRVKLEDGRSRREDSLAAIAIMRAAHDEIWDAYVNDPRVVKAYPGDHGGRGYEPRLNGRPPPPPPSMPMPHFAGRE